MHENIGPGTYRMLEHQLHWCECMIGSSLAVMNWRPAGRLAHVAGQTGDEIRIGGRKLEIAQLVRPNPPEICNSKRRRFTSQEGTNIEVESNRFRDVIVLGREELLVDANFYPKFFEDFALKRDFEGLSCLHFAARKFP